MDEVVTRPAVRFDRGAAAEALGRCEAAIAAGESALATREDAATAMRATWQGRMRDVHDDLHQRNQRDLRDGVAALRRLRAAIGGLVEQATDLEHEVERHNATLQDAQQRG